MLPARLRIALTSALYLAALACLRSRIPDGLCNDTAEEALRGVHLIEEKRFEVITGVIGNSAETLYLYLLGGVVKLLGSSTLAIQVTSWGFALATVWLLVGLLRRLDPRLPSWLPFLGAASSIWLFHYARSGLRAISAPVFALGFCLLLHVVEKNRKSWSWAVICGGVLGLGVYAYTACRVLPIAFLAYCAVRLAFTRESRSFLLRSYGLILLGALVASIPNCLFLLHGPEEFVSRGDYVLRGAWADRLVNLLWCFLLPFHYPDMYRDLQGPGYFFDGVAASLTCVGVSPIHPLIACAFLLGFVPAWRLRREPGMLFLFLTALTGTLVLGIAGPSLTRLLIVLPFYLAVAVLGFGAILHRLPRFGPVVPVALTLVVLTHGWAYFVQLPKSEVSSGYLAPRATAIGERAQQLAIQGKRVLCVVSRDANVVRYLTHDVRASVAVIEFFARPVSLQEIPIQTFRPQVGLIERNPHFDPVAAALRRALGGRAHDRFEEVLCSRMYSEP
ncbi:MAG: hypothetical protein JXQ29_06985 [Planctomycetes bacterium]|nr:hypothetical protein [Planctomycetota bacterium]